MTVASEIEEARQRLITRQTHGVERGAASKNLLQIASGAYLELGPSWPAWQVRRTIAFARMIWLLQSSPELIMTLESAALLHGLPVTGPVQQLHVVGMSASNEPRSLPSSSGTGRQLVTVRHRFTVAESDIVTVEGIRTVSLERLILDMARLRPAGESLPVTDAALRTLTRANRFEQQETWTRAAPILTSLMERVEELAGHRGIRRARDVLPLSNPLSESWGESRMRWAALALGLPEPVTQKHVVAAGQDYFLDNWIEQLGVGFEFDGLVKYDTTTAEGKNAFIREKQRNDNLFSAGITAHRIIQRDVATLSAADRAFTRCLGPDVMRGFNPRRRLL